MFEVWRKTHLMFVERLIIRLASDVPGFNSEMLANELYVLQEEMPVNHDDPEVAKRSAIALDFLGDITGAVESGIQESLERRKGF
ncbi:hypothetical protein AAFN47_18860 [Hoeflea sp. CAU 1731]